MGVKVFWTDFAKLQLRHIFDYHHEKVNLKIARKIIAGIVSEAKLLALNSEIGQVEDLLLPRKEDFRYLIFTNYKIVYWINKKKGRIEIADVFDTRQNPVKMKREK